VDLSLKEKIDVHGKTYDVFFCVEAQEVGKDM
jgi:hypothetical protein